MEKTVFLVILVLILGFFTVPALLIRRKFTSNLINSFHWLLRHGQNRLAYSVSEEPGMGRGMLYCPHPFTNWSLNPQYCNTEGEKAHTKEGFRKTDFYDSILEMKEKLPGAKRIVCIGGSTTYCTEVTRYQDTWPARLTEKITDKNAVVFNFGVGGWGITQSLIRCISWLPRIRPHLLIFYQLKNEFTFYYNAPQKENFIYPDYQNALGQYSQVTSLRFPGWMLNLPLLAYLEMKRIKNLDISSLYKPSAWANPEGLGRVDDQVIEGIINKVEALLDFCSAQRCKVLFVPEIVKDIESNPIAEAYARVIERTIQKLEPRLKGRQDTRYFDCRESFKNREDLFLDKMHFNEKGCDYFAQIIAPEAALLI